MIDPVVVFTPILILLILALFRFVGCKSFGSTAEPVATPGAPPPAPLTYEQVIAATPGLAAHWRLNETGGNLANVLGPLKPAADGTYKTGAGGAGLTLGKPGALAHKDPKDFAPVFAGESAYIEVPFNAPLNPAPNVAFTIELWVKPNPPAGGNVQVVISSHKVDASNNRGYEIALVEKSNEPHHQVRARVFSTGAATPSEITVQPNQGKPDDWRQVVLTYQGSPSGNKLTLYVRVIGSTNPFKGGLTAASYENVLAANAVLLRFAAGHRDGVRPDNHFTGSIDEVAFYNAALSETDIENHFKQF